MTIVLSDATRKLLDERMKAGGYDTAEEAVRAALEALGEQEEQRLDDETLDAIDRAEEQIERGKTHDWKSVREQVRSEFLGK